MSSTAPTKRSQPTNTLPSGKGVYDWVKPFLTTTVGMKVTTAITGTALTLFVIAHLIGNLKIYDGRDSLNAYAHFLKSLGPWLWVARIGLLVAFTLHLVFALYLKKRSSDARPVKYAYKQTVQASWASRTMPWTGLVILAFVLFHLAHFTLGMVGTTDARQEMARKIVQVGYMDLIDDKGRPDVYSMVVAGFSNNIVCVCYVIAQLLLMVHLSHGIASVFQTLGLNTPRIQPALKRLAWGIAILIAIGNIGIVASVRLSWLGDSYVPITRVGDAPPAPVSQPVGEQATPPKKN
ncbi:succinate dehydrogenase cytochrome b subunit [Zavarzinella formosa]|uniref:succinate dehydrogenase cytochrome b subunit n=1 Tax=Zavarzinella formosa TaxID=360055 RepID=UPI00036DA0A7|nr:succinate dehydrogenase cytochrome b subunit [Zavarzinella formosa]